MKYTILIADDKNSITEIEAYNLKKEGYKVFFESNGKKALEKAKDLKPDLIILGMLIPKMDGVEICEKLRELEKFQPTLIVFTSKRVEDYAQLSAYDAGADDYFVKPMTRKLFLRKVKALLRRSEKYRDSQKNIKIADLSIEFESHKVFKAGKSISLVKKEFKLLRLLVSKPGKIFSRDEIINKIWESDVVVGDRTIDVHIRKLRKKIGSDYFKTLKGVGYKFNEELVKNKK